MLFVKTVVPIRIVGEASLADVPIAYAVDGHRAFISVQTFLPLLQGHSIVDSSTDVVVERATTNRTVAVVFFCHDLDLFEEQAQSMECYVAK